MNMKKAISERATILYFLTFTIMLFFLHVVGPQVHSQNAQPTTSIYENPSYRTEIYVSLRVATAK
jgi:hypothetical protein